VDREDPNRNAREGSRDSGEDPGFRAVRVDDVGPLPPEQPVELDQAKDVVPRIDRPADMAERDVLRAGPLGGLNERPRAPRRDGDVELLDEPREQMGDVRLRAPDLGERDRDQEAGAPGRWRYDDVGVVVGTVSSLRCMKRNTAMAVNNRIFTSSHSDQFSM